MGRLIWTCAFAAVAGVSAGPALADDIFQSLLSNDTNAIEERFGYDNVEDLVDAIDPVELQQSLSYDCDTVPTVTCDGVSGQVGFRGLPLAFVFAENSGDLQFRIPDPDAPSDQSRDIYNNTFQGQGFTLTEQRDDALDQLKDFLKSDAPQVKEFYSQLAAKTSTDPIAGNPNSLMTQKMFADFAYGFTHKTSQVWACGTSAFNRTNDAPIQLAAAGAVSDIFADAEARAAALRAENELGVGLLVTSTQAPASSSTTLSSDTTVRTLTVPLSYTVKFDANPSHKLHFDLPLAYTDTAGATTASFGFGIAYTYPIQDVWSLTPAIGVGATGSEDLGAAGGVSAYSLTSAYTWRLGSFGLSMGNALGRYQSLEFKVGDYEAGADIANTVFTNGLLLTGPDNLIASNLVMEYFVTDTRITGDEVYSSKYDELGVALGYIGTENGLIDSYFKAGLSYLVGEHDLKSLKLALTMRF